MVDETGVDEPKVDETAVDEPGPHRRCSTFKKKLCQQNK